MENSIFNYPIIVIIVAAILLSWFIERGRKKYVVEELEKTKNWLSKFEFKSFMLSDLDLINFEASLLTGPFGIEIPHEPHLGGKRFKENQKLIGKVFYPNHYSESLDDLKDRMEQEGFFPANLQEVMSWCSKNGSFMKADQLYFITALDGKSIRANMCRVVVTQYAGVLWSKSKGKMICAHAEADTNVLYLGIKPE